MIILSGQETGGGRAYDGLTDEEASLGREPDIQSNYYQLIDATKAILKMYGEECDIGHIITEYSADECKYCKVIWELRKCL